MICYACFLTPIFLVTVYAYNILLLCMKVPSDVSEEDSIKQCGLFVPHWRTSIQLEPKLLPQI